MQHKKLVRRLRSEYTRVERIGGKWACFLQVKHQGFCVVRHSNKKLADWYSLQLAKALGRVLVENAKGEARADSATSPHGKTL